MDYIQFKSNGDQPTGITHLAGMQGFPDYTLCGITLDDDERTAGHNFSVKPQKINCPDCVTLVKFCRDKSIKI